MTDRHDAGLSPDARALFDAARGEGGLTAGDRARIRRGLDARIAAAVAAGAGAATVRAGAAHATGHAATGSLGAAIAGSSVAAKAVVAALVVVAAAGVGVVGARGHGPPRTGATPAHIARVQTTTTVAPAARAPSVIDRATAAPDAPPRASAPLVVDVPRAAPSRTRRAASHATAAHAVPGESDAARLGRAIMLDNAGRGAEALALLELDHPADARSDAGHALRDERAALHAILLCEAGRAAEAAPEASAVLARAPHSPFAPRLRRVCNVDGAPAPP